MKTEEGLPPQRADRKSYKVLARPHNSRHWYPTEWSQVTRKEHAEWREKS